MSVRDPRLWIESMALLPHLIRLKVVALLMRSSTLYSDAQPQAFSHAKQFAGLHRTCQTLQLLSFR